MAKFKLENQEPEEPADIPSEGGWWRNVETFLGGVGEKLTDYGMTNRGDIEREVRGLPPKEKIAEDPANAEQAAQTTDVQAQTGQGDGIAGIGTVTGPGNFEYQFRPITGFAPVGNKPPDLNTLKSNFDGLVIENPTTPGVQILNPKVFQPGKSGSLQYYKGDGLTNELGQLARRQYDTSSGGLDARNELMYLNRKEGATLLLLKELKRTDFYGNNEISSLALNNLGFTPEDELAMTRFLDYSNQRFQTWQAVFPQLGQFSGQQSTSGPKFRPISDADMGSYLQEYSLLLTGNKLTKEKLKNLLRESVNVQKAAFSAGQDIPRPSTIAEQTIIQSQSTQAASFGLGNAIGAAFAALGASRG